MTKIIQIEDDGHNNDGPRGTHSRETSKLVLLAAILDMLQVCVPISRGAQFVSCVRFASKLGGFTRLSRNLETETGTVYDRLV